MVAKVAKRAAEIVSCTPSREHMRLTLWDDGRASLSFNVMGTDGEFVTVSRSSSAAEMRQFVKDAAEVLGLVVSEPKP